MSDVLREVLELKREIVEARNQAIKTDNQVKNLGLDIKSFDRRFDMLEHRTRLFSITAHVLVAVVCGLSAYAMVRGVESNHHRALHEAQESGRVLLEASGHREESLKRKLGQMEQADQAHRVAVDIAGQILDLLEKRQDRDAANLLEKFIRADLTPLEQRFVGKPFADLRQKELELSLKAGRLAVVQGRYEQGIIELQRVVMLDSDNQWGPMTRPLLGQALYLLQRYTESEMQWRLLIQQGADPSVMEEAHYYLGLCAIRLDQVEEGVALLRKLERENSRFASNAKAYLQAIEQRTELPQDLFGGKIKTSKLPRTSSQAASTNEPNKPAPLAPQQAPSKPIPPVSP